jgi:hypothetical protein
LQNKIKNYSTMNYFKRGFGKSIQARIQARKRNQVLRPRTQAVGGNGGGIVRRTGGGLGVRSKIALQTARKNVQKAKRLLAARKSQMNNLLVNI